MTQKQEVAPELLAVLKLCPKRHSSQKIMFGCPVIFVRGKMFAGVYRQSLFIRVGKETKLKLVTAKKAGPFRAKGREMKEYIAFRLPLKGPHSLLSKLVRSALRNLLIEQVS